MTGPKVAERQRKAELFTLFAFGAALRHRCSWASGRRPGLTQTHAIGSPGSQAFGLELNPTPGFLVPSDHSSQMAGLLSPHDRGSQFLK